MNDETKITIRKALPEDIDAYTNCANTCWQAAYKGIVPDEYLDSMLTNKALREKNLERLQNPGFCQHYCVLHGPETIGLLIIDTMHSEIWAVYLTPAYWGRGYGRELLNFATSVLKNAGHKKVTLWVFEANHRARRFYEKHGFVLSGQQKTVDKYGGVPLVEVQYMLAI
ncbi:MAG: GNAT family N-acetyltransferase [Defluviitaleaceae bacterium]|nr:GNAT family N-acetyltransferase [Defluviitaleaceae bacterium]